MNKIVAAYLRKHLRAPEDAPESTPKRMQMPRDSQGGGLVADWPVRAPMALALEPRFMFDAAGGATGAQLAEQAAAESITAQNHDQDENPAQAVISGEEQSSRTEVVVIDSAIDDFQTLLDGVDPSLDIIVLDPGADVHDLAQALSGYSNVDAVHLFTHGSTGSLNFSGGALTLDNLNASQDALLTIGKALSADGDLLLYGCNVGADGAGLGFVEALANATGADVAASDDLTGAADLGGDWALEITSGKIETAIRSQSTGYQGVLGISDENFDGTAATFDLAATSLTVNDWTFTASATTRILMVGDAAAGGVNSFLNHNAFVGAGGKSLFMNDQSNGHKSFTVKSADGTDFDLVSFKFNNKFDTGAKDIVIAAYRDGVEVVSGATVDMNTSASYGGITYSKEYDPTSGQNMGYSGSFTFSSAYDNIDEIRFSAASEFGFVIDDIDVSPVVSNSLPDLGGTPADDTATEDVATAIDLSAYNVSDGDGDTVTLTLGVDRGTIASTDGNGTTSGVTVANSGTASMTLQGSVADLNTYLNDTSKITYTTASNDTTSATLTVTPNDGTGNGTADTVAITITPVNDAPTLTGEPSDVTVTEDTASNVDLSSSTLADVDTTTADLTLTITAGAGTLTASSGGSVTVSNSGTSAITLTGTATNIDTYLNTASNIKYTGASNANGNDVTTLTLTVNDQDGSGTVNVGTVNVDITGVNDAPVLDNSKSPAMSSITEDLAAPSNGSTANSILVAGLIDNGGSLSNYTDVEGDSVGIAITAVNANGTLYYSTDGGTNWTAVGAVAANSARVLHADANTRVYFKPDANYNGSLTDAFTFKAWDRTGGHNNGDATVDTTSGTAFSSATDTVSLTVTAVNDDPTVTGLPSDITVTEDTASNVDLSAITFADVDSASNSISLVLTAGAGTLTASSGGSVTISNSGTSAITLSGTVSNIDTYLNTASNIQYTSASNASGNNVTTLNLTSNDGGAVGSGGGNNVDHGNVNIDITNVNDAPSTSGTYNFTSINEDTTATGVTVATIVAGLTTSDADSNTLGIAVTGTTGNGTWQFSHDSSNGTDGTWTSFASVSTPAASTSLLLAHTAYVRYVPDGANAETATITVRGWDQTSGTASSGTTARYADTSTNGNATPYSSGTATGSQAVTAVNDVPVVDLDASAGGVTYSTTFSAGGSSVTIANTDATYSDVDTSDTQASLTATLTTRPDGDGVESLSLNTAASTAATNAGLTVGYTSSTGVLSITGAASTSVYQTVLRGIVYNNTDAAADITTGNRTINVVGNDGDGNSSTAAATLSVVTAPVTDLNGATAGTGVTTSFTEDGGAVVIAGSATVTEPDGDNLNQFVVTLTNAQTGDILKVGARSNGDVVNGITITETSSSVITLSGAASATNYQALIREITFNNTSNDPNTTARSITFAGRDVNGNTGASDTATVNVTGVNDEPTLAATGSNPTFTEGGGNASLFSGASISTVDSGQNVTSMVMTVTNLSNGASEILVIDGTDVALTNGTSGTSAANSFGYSVAVSGSTATVTITKTDTTANYQTLVNALAYKNTSDDPTANNSRVATLTTLNDDGGTANGGDNSVTVVRASTITVAAGINDEPTLSATGASPTFTIGGAGSALFSGATFSTVEAGQNIKSMVLTVTNLSDGAGEKLIVDGTEFALTHGTNGNSAANTFGYAVSVAGSTATVTITKTDTAANYKTMVEGIAYKNTGDPATLNADRVATITTVDDSGGTTNGGDDSATVSIASTITVAAAPQQPTSNTTNLNISQVAPKPPAVEPSPPPSGGVDPSPPGNEPPPGSETRNPGGDTGGVTPGDPNADAGFTFGGDPTTSQGVDTIGIIGVAVSGNDGALSSFYGAGNAASSNGTGADAANGGSGGTSSSRGSMSALLGGGFGGGLGGGFSGGGAGGGLGGATGGETAGGAASVGGPGAGTGTGGAGPAGGVGAGAGFGPGGDGGAVNGQNDQGQTSNQGLGPGLGQGQGQGAPAQGAPGQGGQPPQPQGGGQDGAPPASGTDGQGGQPQGGQPLEGQGGQEGAFFKPGGRTSFTDQLADAAQTQQSSLDKLIEAMERLAS